MFFAEANWRMLQNELNGKNCKTALGATPPNPCKIGHFITLKGNVINYPILAFFSKSLLLQQTARDLTMTIIRCRDLIRCCFPATADPVIKSAYCDVVFTAPVSICHTALAAFIDKPDLFRHRNTGFASSCHNLSSVIVVK